MNVALVAPEGTVTLGGVLAVGLLLERVTLRPAFGAGPVRVTVPVEVAPPPTVVGLRLIPLSEDGLIVRFPFAVEPVILAVT